jgi:hypothetical protein
MLNCFVTRRINFSVNSEFFLDLDVGQIPTDELDEYLCQPGIQRRRTRVSLSLKYNLPDRHVGSLPGKTLPSSQPGVSRTTAFYPLADARKPIIWKAQGCKILPGQGFSDSACQFVGNDNVKKL